MKKTTRQFDEAQKLAAQTRREASSLVGRGSALLPVFDRLLPSRFPVHLQGAHCLWQPSATSRGLGLLRRKFCIQISGQKRHVIRPTTPFNIP